MKKTILSLMLVSSSIFAMEGKTMTVYKSPYCGCCEKWIDIMKKEGFKTKTIDINEVNDIKQKEKIGLIPKGVIYEYNTEKQTKKKDTHSELKQTSENRKKITMAFISMLGDLPAEDADKIIIPTSVLSKLLGE